MYAKMNSIFVVFFIKKEMVYTSRGCCPKFETDKSPFYDHF